MSARDPRPHVLISPTLHSHPAAKNLQARGMWSWVSSICWLSRNGRRDSFPRTIAREFDATRSVTTGLIAEGFWVDSADEIGVPQWVYSRYSGRPVQLWKFGAIEGGRRKIPDALRLAVYERDGFTCLHCGDVESLTLDHIYPYSRGGEDTLENLQTLCRPCNSRKGARV